MRGRAMTEEEFSVGEKCASLKAATGMLAADGDELAMIEFVFVWECLMEVSMTNIFIPCVSHDGGILGPTMFIF